MRPLIMHSIHRRILAWVRLPGRPMAETMAASAVHQLGVVARDGCVKAFHATAALVEHNPGKPIMSCDVSAAHQSLDRAWMMQEVHDLCPVLERPLAVWYPRDELTTHWWRTSDGKVVDIPAGNGLDQGCILAAADGRRQLDARTQRRSTEWARAGLQLNAGKTKIFALDPDLPLGDWHPRRVPVLKCFGADLTDDGIGASYPGGRPERRACAVGRQARGLRLQASRARGQRAEHSARSIPAALRDGGQPTAHPHVQTGDAGTSNRP